jgi:hypothetical protein
MKSLFICFIVTFFSTYINNKNEDVFYYKQATQLILKSSEVKKYKLKVKNYHISSEIISFSNFNSFFKDELKSDYFYEQSTEKLVKLDSTLLSLNIKKCGKLKMFFSEIKNNVFFAEIFVSKKDNLKYGDRSIFGSSNIYMFKIINENVHLVKVKTIHYN